MSSSPPRPETPRSPVGGADPSQPGPNSTGVPQQLGAAALPTLLTDVVAPAAAASVIAGDLLSGWTVDPEQALPHGAPDPAFPPPALYAGLPDPTQQQQQQPASPAGDDHQQQQQPSGWSLRISHPLAPNPHFARSAQATAPLAGSGGPGASAGPSSADGPSAAAIDGDNDRLTYSSSRDPRRPARASNTSSTAAAADPTRRWGRVIDALEPMDVDAVLGGTSAAGRSSGSSDDDDDDDDVDINWHADPLWLGEDEPGASAGSMTAAVRMAARRSLAASTSATGGAAGDSGNTRSSAARTGVGAATAGGDAWMEAVWGLPTVYAGGSSELPHGSADAEGGAAAAPGRRRRHLIPEEEVGDSDEDEDAQLARETDEDLLRLRPRYGYVPPSGRAGRREQRSVVVANQDRKEAAALGWDAKGETWIAGRRQTMVAGTSRLDGGEGPKPNELPSYLRQHPYLRSPSITSSPLPSHFSSTDHSSLLAISTSGLSASYLPMQSRNDRDAASVRSDVAIPPSVGLFYFEVEIVDAGQRGYIGVGLSGKGVNLGRLPGWERGSWGYHGDDGMVFGEKGQGKEFGPGFTTGDVVGCGLDVGQSAVFYTKNGVLLGHVFHGLSCEGLHPTIGLRTPREEVRANFGQFPFRYDIAGHFAGRQAAVLSTVRASPPAAGGSHASKPGPSSSFRPPVRALSADDRQVLRRLIEELRVARAQAEDGRADWNVLSSRQRAVWELMESTRSAETGGVGLAEGASGGTVGKGPEEKGPTAPSTATTDGHGKDKASTSTSAGASASAKTAGSGARSGKAGANGAARLSKGTRGGAAAQNADAVRALVGDFLAHQGHGATLAAFERNSAPASSAPSSPTTVVDSLPAPTVTLDREIHQAIVRGRVDSAIGLLERRFPAVLDSAAGFKLRCAKLVRMIIEASTAVGAHPERPTSSLPSMSSSRKRKASLASVDPSQPPGKAFRSGAHPELSPSTSPPVRFTQPAGNGKDQETPSFGLPPSSTADEAMDRILSYARSLALLARPPSVGTPTATPACDMRARERLLEASLGLLAFAAVGRTRPAEDAVGGPCVEAWEMGMTVGGLEAIADRIDERLLDAAHVGRESPLGSVVRHTLAVHRQMGAVGLGLGAFVDVERELSHG